MALVVSFHLPRTVVFSRQHTADYGERVSVNGDGGLSGDVKAIVLPCQCLMGVGCDLCREVTACCFNVFFTLLQIQFLLQVTEPVTLAARHCLVMIGLHNFDHFVHRII